MCGVEVIEVVYELLFVVCCILLVFGDGLEMLVNWFEKNSGMVCVVVFEVGLLGLVYLVLFDFLWCNLWVYLMVMFVVGGDFFVLVVEGVCDILCICKFEIVFKGWEFIEVKNDVLIIVCGLMYFFVNWGCVECYELG